MVISNTPSRRRRRRLGFGAELFAVQVGVISIVIALFTWAAVAAQATIVRQENEVQIRSLAQAIATLPTVVDGLASADPTAEIQPVMQAMRAAAGVDYITVVDAGGLRVAHPDPALIGAPPSTDHSAILAGAEFVGVEAGTLGPTFRVKLPVRAADGTILGSVSVGVLETRLTNDVVTRAWQLIGVAAVALVVGSTLSWLVTRAIRRRLYGVDPDALLTLLQTRDSMLAGVSDGFIAVDVRGRVALANAAAERITGRHDLVGSEAATALPRALAAVVAGEATTAGEAAKARPATRLPLQLDGRSVVVTRSEAEIGGRRAGVTLLIQDRTDLERALDDLDTQTARADAMRRETHEFENRMHVIGGLLSLGEVDEAARLLAELPAASRPGARGELARIGPPVLAALLATHLASAEAEGVRVTLSADSTVEADYRAGSDEISVLGNLLANAVDAARSRVDVYVRGDAEGLECRIDDDGPGVPPARRTAIFDEGVSTKPATLEGRGVGLHVVAGIVAARGGTIEVDDAPLGGAAFEVWLPARLRARPSAAGTGPLPGTPGTDDAIQGAHGDHDDGR